METTLQDFLPASFTELTDAELKLLQAASNGNVAKCGTIGAAIDGQCGKDREIRAKLIRWLCKRPDLQELIDPRGLVVSSAKITGSLNLSFLKVIFPLTFFRCQFQEKILIRNSDLRQLALNGCQTKGLDGTGATVRGDLSLANNFTATGRVDLSGCTVGGDLDCHGAVLHADTKKGTALRASRSKIGRRVRLCNGFRAEGRVNFIGAEIDGDFDCTGGSFSNPSSAALVADASIIQGDVKFCHNSMSKIRGPSFKAHGEVSLVSAEISGALRCSGGVFTNPKGVALSADNVKINRDMFLDENFTAEGLIRLLGADIRGDLDTTGARVANSTISMARSHVGTLRDSVESWPERGNLDLGGFTYDRIADAPVDAKLRLKWLRLVLPAEDKKLDGAFSPQPYRQLANVLGRQGHDAEARKILIGLEDDRRKYGGLSWFGRQWAWVLWATIAYGYRPIRAFIFIAVFVALGFVIFGSAYQAREMVPSEKDAYEYEQTHQGTLPSYYEPFCALTYSFDTFVPIIDLGQRNKWTPGVIRTIGAPIRICKNKMLEGILCAGNKVSLPRAPALWFVRVFRWFDIIAGWFFTSLFVAGVAGLVRKE